MMQYTYGYARVSTKQQDLIRQLDLLSEYNCTEILTEKMSGTKKDRPELIRLKDKVRPGDSIVVESFSRLGRSTKDLIELVEYFENKNVKLISIKENFDTNTPQGKLMLTVFQAFSQFERDLIAQRTKEGLESARARGRNGGRPKVKEKQINKALNLYHSKEYSISEIVEMTGISQATLYRYIGTKGQSKENQAPINQENTAIIRMGLRIENNNKFVRGKGKVRDSIEQFLKHHYNMVIIANEYIIYVPYTTVDALKKTVYDILGELDSEADMRNCFIEADVYCDELGLTW
ncbi:MULTISPECIES: recombinase family protein [Bacillaceae]|uniref:recombinase family protein n=1 Tax=Bacillaceae TaxID=186817 RepID=UPI0009E5A3B9|nr:MULTISPECIES: recombinase family protein [Bacillaceae]NRG44042.1 recombinase family protein [Bacillus sp. CRN 9]MBF8118959.1 recombinase family protein [Bacillus cereus]MBU8732465.1 recombinase family protein [Cytobacillus oceanisediminis]MCM3324746.1 recombinase family protein [Cytobacillus kochii]MCM3347139.1 recombinase family protein [Cytobacillus kochii]